ncbi:MAG: hypothetical protein GWN11_06545 [Candidatus Dadabacteria bacterium]|nr:hypothetical protein [Candidatus Dadabacteria bacterium]
MSNENDADNKFSSNQKALAYLDKLVVSRDFDPDDREYIRFTLIPMLTRVIENMDDGFAEELRYMAMDLCMKLIPADEQYQRFVEDWIKKKKVV